MIEPRNHTPEQWSMELKDQEDVPRGPREMIRVEMFLARSGDNHPPLALRFAVPEEIKAV